MFLRLVKDNVDNYVGDIGYSIAASYIYPITKLQLRYSFFDIFKKVLIKSNLNPSLSPGLIHCLQRECCANTPFSKNVAFFKHLCIR